MHCNLQRQFSFQIIINKIAKFFSNFSLVDSSLSPCEFKGPLVDSRFTIQKLAFSFCPSKRVSCVRAFFKLRRHQCMSCTVHKSSPKYCFLILSSLVLVKIQNTIFFFLIFSFWNFSHCLMTPFDKNFCPLIKSFHEIFYLDFVTLHLD